MTRNVKTPDGRSVFQATKEAVYDERTELVKVIVAKESAARDTNTARLKALRLAREAEAKIGIKPEPKKPRRHK
jgi:hypothetical protein